MTTQAPEAGFYYHYKHNPAGAVNNYAYEVMGIGHHTEIDGLEESAMVMYRPLYEAPVYKLGKHWHLRPLHMFMEDVMKDGNKVKRFTRILDEKIIEELALIRDTMYS